MHIFRWLTGNKNHHIEVRTDVHGTGWWMIVRTEEDGSTRDVANCPTPGFKDDKLAIENAREFLDSIGADYLEVEPETKL